MAASENIVCWSCGAKDSANLYYCEKCRANLHLSLEDQMRTKQSVDESIQTEPSSSEPAEPPMRHFGMFFLMFWFSFLATPILALCLPALMKKIHLPGINSGMSGSLSLILFTAMSGSLVSGFALGKLFSKTMGQLIARGILYSVGIFAFYLI